MNRQRPATSHRTKMNSDPISPITQSSYIRSINMYKNKKTEKNFIIQHPKQIPYDKEQLYEDVWRYKEQVNKLNEEIRRQRIENENLERTIKQLETNAQERTKQVESREIPPALRAQVKDYQRQLKETQTELQNLKRDTRATNLQEMQIELETIRDECRRLAAYIQAKSEQEKQESLILTSLPDHQSHSLLTSHTLLAAYKQDNIHLSTMIQQLEEERAVLQGQLQTQTKEAERWVLKAKTAERQVKDLNTHLDYMRTQNGNIKKVPLKQENEQLRRSVAKFQEDTATYIQQLQEQAKKIQDQHNRIRDLETEQTLFRTLEMKEREKLNEKMVQLRKENERLERLCVQDEEEDNMVESQHHSEVLDTRRSLLARESASSQKSLFGQPEPIRSSRLIASKRKLPRTTCSELRTRLMLNSVQFTDELLVNGSEDTVTMQAVIEALKRDPLRIENHDHVVAIARYLVEDNTEEYQVYEPYRTQEKAIVRSVFRKIIGQYKLFTEDETKSLVNGFITLFNKWNASIESALKQVLAKKKHLSPGTCEPEDMDMAYSFCDINLNQRQREFLDIQNYGVTNSLAIIDYQHLLNHYAGLHAQRLAEAEQLEQQKIEATRAKLLEDQKREDEKIEQAMVEQEEYNDSGMDQDLPVQEAQDLVHDEQGDQVEEAPKEEDGQNNAMSSSPEYATFAQPNEQAPAEDQFEVYQFSNELEAQEQLKQPQDFEAENQIEGNTNLKQDDKNEQPETQTEQDTRFEPQPPE